MRVVFFLLFLACAANWLFISVAAKSAMHETTAAVVGLSALVALAAACILDAISSAGGDAKKREELRLAELRALKTIAAQTGEQIALIAASASTQVSASVKQLAAAEHSNALLQWLGEKQPAAAEEFVSAE